MVDVNQPPLRSLTDHSLKSSPYYHDPAGAKSRDPHSANGGSASARRERARIICPHKKTDFRHALWVKERKSLQKKARQSRFRVEIGKQPKGNVITVDTSKARSNVDVLRLCLIDLGWREHPAGRRDGAQCDIHWHSAQYQENPDLYTGWVNKFPGMVEVVRKVSLSRTLDIMRNLFPEDYDFHPLSWYLPQQFAEFTDAARRANLKQPSRKPYYIVKPDEGSQGDGIYLITDPKDYLFNNKQHVVQQYIAHPLLLDDLKFDFRIYVVITSLEPLKVYIHSEGLARFCTVPYRAPSAKNRQDAFMHLTNYSLNKRSRTYNHTDTDDDGSKRTLSSVMKKLDYMGYDVKRLEYDLDSLVVKTVIAMAPELKVEMNAAIPPGKAGPKCFQILGFDILLTDTLKPILLEVNANPSLRIDYENEIAPGINEYIHSPVDEEIKKSLVLSTLKTVCPKKKRRRRRSMSVNEIQNMKGTDRPFERDDWVQANGKENKPIKNKAEKKTNKDPKRLEATSYHKGKIERTNTYILATNEVHETSRQTDDEEVEDEEGHGEVLQTPDFNPLPMPELKQIYPEPYAEQFQELLLMDRTVEIFLSCLGVRGSLRMGATSFRNFTRKGKLTWNNGSGFSNASLDILFIDLQRRWEYTNPGNTSGLCYQGFLEAFFLIAQKKFPSENQLSSAKSFLVHCESHIDSSDIRPYRSYLPRLDRVDLLEKRTAELKQMSQTSAQIQRMNSCFMSVRTLATPISAGRPPVPKGKKKSHFSSDKE